MTNQDRCVIGTSGWHYDHWIERFYPKEIPSEAFLSYYAKQFKTVEINNSFYHLPTKDTIHRWASQTPDDFCFAVKANRYITHMKNLIDPQEPVQQLLDAIKLLKQKVGPILFQLPPQWSRNEQRLASFLQILPPKFAYAFEFRNLSWYTEEIVALLKDHQVALCIHDKSGKFIKKTLTADFVYLRLHGPNGKYQQLYDREQLKTIAEDVHKWRESGISVYIYFNNDAEANALRNAQELIEMLKR